jgi:hypothetical protein
MAMRLCHFLAAGLMCLLPIRSDAARVISVRVDPPTLLLQGPSASHSLLIDGQTDDGRLVDLTRSAHFESADPKVARVTPAGMVQGASDGKTIIRVEVEGKTLHTEVSVTGSALPRRLSYVNDVLPILSRHGCNSSGCHGKAEGQNGFKLSVFGFDPAADLAALTKEDRGRRVFLPAPEHSLLLRKMAGLVPHGGGARVPARSADFETVRAWIAAGTPLGAATDPVVESVRVEPAERLLLPGQLQQLRVKARYSDGRDMDVTRYARFQSNNDGLAAIAPSGLVSAGEVPGEAALMASFMNEVAVCRVAVPRTQKIEPYPAFAANNFIDRHILAKLMKLNVAPSELAVDAEYLRRVYLDVIGTLPTAAEARRFLNDPQPDRRARLVDELLARPEFADYWALQWADLLRVERSVLGHKRALAYYRWIHESLAANKPFDQFARELVTAEGPLAESGPAGFYRATTKPGEMASTLAQVFLGVRIACAECHHHPFDRWTQADYHGLTAYFAGVSIRASPLGEVLVAEVGIARMARTGEAIPAFALGEPRPELKNAAAGDQRRALAEWMTQPDNPWFARNLANRVWAHFLGRGLVDPVDDARATNPPSNPELLDALARHAVESKYDLRALIRTITASRTYQLSSRPNATNERDEQNYSRALFRRLPAEVLFDMVCQTTGVPERFSGAPPGTRAIQLWDSKTTHYFLKVFGRPERISACECERNQEPSVAQVLHLLNAPEIQGRMAHAGGSLARLCKRLPDDGALVEELYLTFYSRLPLEAERKRGLDYLKDHHDRRQAAEDLAWALMNSLEFLFNH